MPNFGLVVTPTYDPISYEQYVLPFKDYAEVYNTIADAYDTLEMEANKWEKLANSSQDQTLYNQYLNYAKDIRAAAQDLSEKGLNTKTRGMVSKLRQRYAAEIKPIEDAYNLREKEREMQRQALLLNPDIMFSRDASNTGLGAYMNGTPALQTYNGARLYEYTSKALEQLAKTAREDLMVNGSNSEWYDILEGQYYQKDNYTGVTPLVVMQSMFDSNGDIRPEANEYLSAVINGAIDLSGMRNWNNWNDIKGRAYNYVNQGLWSAVGTTEEKQLSNKYYEYALRQEEEARRAAMSQTNMPINPRNIYSRTGRSKAQQQYDKYVKDNEQIKINSDGTWEVGTVSTDIEIEPGIPSSITTIDNELIKIFAELYAKEYPNEEFPTLLHAKVYMEQYPKIAGNLIKKYFQELGVGEETGYDATRYTEYNYAYDSEQLKEIKDAILPLLLNTNLQAVDWDNKTESYVVTGKELKAKDLQESTILESNFSAINGVPYSIISVKHKDGSVGVYKMPAGVNRLNEAARDLSLIYAELCRKELARIYKDPNTINNNTGNPYTEAEITALLNAYNNHLQNAYKGHSQIGLKYKTQNVTIPGYGY